jgi:hypothetical protein
MHGKGPNLKYAQMGHVIWALFCTSFPFIFVMLINYFHFRSARKYLRDQNSFTVWRGSLSVDPVLGRRMIDAENSVGYKLIFEFYILMNRRNCRERLEGFCMREKWSGILSFKDGLYTGYCCGIPIPMCWYWYSIVGSQKSSIPNTKPIPKL